MEPIQQIHWGAPKRLDSVRTADGSGLNAKLAVSATGRRMGVVWTGPDGLKAASSQDGGASWTKTSRLSPRNMGYAWDLGGSDDGKSLTAVWVRGGGETLGPVEFATSRDGGRSWSTPKTIPSLGLSFPHLAMSSDGRTAVVGGSSGNDEDGNPLSTAATSDAGRTWSTPAVVVAESGTFRHLALSEDGSTARVFYTARGFDPTKSPFWWGEQRMSVSSDGGATWAEPVKLSFPGFDWSDGDLTVASSGDGTGLLAAWAAGQTVVTASQDGGLTWADPVAVVAGDSWGETVTRARDGSNALALTVTSSDVLAARSSDGGQSWQAPVALPAVSPSVGAFRTHEVATSDDGRRVLAIWGVWTRNEDGSRTRTRRWAISSDAGQTWSTPESDQRIGLVGPSLGDLPTMAMSGNGSTVVAVTQQKTRSGWALNARVATFGSPGIEALARAQARAATLQVLVRPIVGVGPQWRFRVQKRTAGGWRLLPRKYRTEGVAQTRTIDLRKGTYRVRVPAQRGYGGDLSGVVTLKR